jgi:hypothetical protein
MNRRKCCLKRYYGQKRVLVFANVIDCYFLATNADRVEGVKPVLLNTVPCQCCIGLKYTTLPPWLHDYQKPDWGEEMGRQEQNEQYPSHESKQRALRILNSYRILN